MLYFDKNILPKGETVMKAKFTAAMILSAMLLTACNKASPAHETERETNTVSQSITTADASEAETTAAASAVTEGSSEIYDEFASKTASEYFDHHIFSLGKFEKGGGVDGHTHGMFLTKSIVCESYFWWDLTDGITHRYLRFYDVDKETMEAEIELPHNFELYSCDRTKIEDSDVLMRAYIFSQDIDRDTYGEVIVRKDYSYDVVTDGSTEYPGIDFYSLGIWGDGGKIFDKRNDVILIDNEEKAANYKFSIDKNSFVYKTTADYGWDNFGIYYMDEGKAVEFPDTGDFFPIGYYNGKIYASITAEDAEGIGEIYSFDADTMEKEKFIAVHTAEDGDGEFINCFMSLTEAGYIAAEFYPSSSSHILYLISLDSREILAKHESNHGYGGTKAMECIDGRIALINFDNDEITVFDMKM